MKLDWDKVIHGVAGGLVAAQPVLLELGVNPRLSAAIVGAVGAFIAGYRTDRSAVQAATDAAPPTTTPSEGTP